MLGYTDFGDVDLDFDVIPAVDLAALRAALEKHYPLTGDGLTLTYRCNYPLAHNTTAFLDAGLFWWDGDIDVSGVAVSADIDGGIDPTIAVGVDYSITPVMALGVHYRYQQLDDQSVDGFGLLLKVGF